LKGGGITAFTDLVHGGREAREAEMEIVALGSWMRGNETGLAQAVTNLLTNAVKFVSPEKIPRC
jgi:signal transduction histidine kinase